MSAPSLVFVAAATDIPSPSDGTIVIVIDPSWTPAAGGRSDVRAARHLLAGVIEGVDLFGEALEGVDAWADAARLPDRLLVEGVTYWFRMRERTWRWLHERLLWRHAIRSAFGDDLASVSMPETEEALHDVIGSLGVPLRIDGTDAHQGSGDAAATSGGHPSSANVGWLESVRAGLRRRTAGRSTAGPTAEWRRRDDVLAARVGRLAAGTSPRVIVVTTPATHHWIHGEAEGGRRDPNLGSVIPRLREAGLEPILVGMGLDQRDDDDWRVIERDESLLPHAFLRTRWAGPDDGDRVARALASVDPVLDGARAVPLDAGGIDLSGPLVDALRTVLARTLTADVHQLARVERLLAELRPRAMLLTHEAIRTPWVVAGARAGVPVAAVQHGVLYPTHPGYPGWRHPALALPTRTFVFGDYERRALLAGAYRPPEVEVSGSPRLDLDADAGDRPSPESERDAVRRELGVADGDKLLVVSTIDLEFIRRTHLVHMLEVTLGGPLPGIHVVFKQHPGEHDAGPYQPLLEGLARVGGYRAPPTTVVKDIDLYRLLRAADAHLGMHSTVLTDAVAAGTPNLIAIVEGRADVLGYVAAGVARPVRNVDEVRAALADPWPPDPVARQAFLDEHFRAGDASGRIADAIRDSMASR